SGEGGGGVSARNGEGEREVARSEYRDRSDRYQHSAQIGAGQRRAVGQRGVDTGAHPRALLEHLGEQAQLTDGAPPLAGQSSLRQPRLTSRAREEDAIEGEDLLRDGAQECGALRWR